MKSTTFTIHGKPFAKQRPRFNMQFGRTYTPSKTVSFERQVGTIAAEHFKDPLKGPVRVVIKASFGIAKSWSKAKKVEQIHRPHTQRPDLDNIGKAILDGLNHIAFADDDQVAELFVSKVWTHEDGGKTVVTVEPIWMEQNNG